MKCIAYAISSFFYCMHKLWIREGARVIIWYDLFFLWNKKVSLCALHFSPKILFARITFNFKKLCIKLWQKRSKTNKISDICTKFLILTIRKEIQRGYYLPWFSHIESNGNNFWRERVTVVELARFRQYFNCFFFFQILFFNQPVRAQFKI